MLSTAGATTNTFGCPQPCPAAAPQPGHLAVGSKTSVLAATVGVDAGCWSGGCMLQADSATARQMAMPSTVPSVLVT